VFGHTVSDKCDNLYSFIGHFGDGINEVPGMKIVTGFKHLKGCKFYSATSGSCVLVVVSAGTAIYDVVVVVFAVYPMHVFPSPSYYSSY